MLIKSVSYKAMLVGRQSYAAVLIDFGRGFGTLQRNEEQDQETLRQAKAQDVFDYGYLIKDLAKQWMARASRITVPPVLIDIVSMCNNRETGMGDIIDLWQKWFVVKEAVQIAGARESEFLQGDIAWESLETKDLTMSFTRSRPSVSKLQGRLGNLSVALF